MASPGEAKLPSSSDKEGANVDKIRDILFGSQMRDYEKRFARLEENVNKAVETLRDDLTKRLEILSGFVQKEVDSLSQRLKAEKSERGEGAKELAQEFKDAAKALEKKIAGLDEQLSDSQSDLRAKILEHSKNFAGEIERLRREAAASLDREVQSLRHDKTDRAALADLLAEFSLRLKDKFELPNE
jgi:DNA repair exonuclease SbcCD ATPase subunit